MNDFQLLETMRAEGGQVYLLDRHLARLNRSAEFFSFRCDLAAIREAVLGSVPQDGTAVTLRLTLAKDGVLNVARRPLPEGYVQRLQLSNVRVNSADPFLYHKTTNRQIYDEARRECDADTDAILVNERGEITETTIANVAVYRGGRWMTPRVSCGLLSGVMREEMLVSGKIVEGVIRADELLPGELIRCFNALRGVCDVPLAG